MNRRAGKISPWNQTVAELAVVMSLMVYVHSTATFGQIIISGNECKLDVRTGEWVVVNDAGPDSISVIDCGQFPPRVQHVYGIANSVIGPPSNVAITPDGKVALVTNAIKLDRNSKKGYAADTLIQIVDLISRPPRLVGTTRAGLQPSGLSLTPDGRWALVANRGAGTVTVLAIDGTEVEPIQTVEVATAEDQVSDVAISPDGKLALVSVQEGHYLSVLELDGGNVALTERKLSVCGRPYRTVITSDGKFGLTAGSGLGAPDLDALTVVDLAADPIRTVDYVPIGMGPESFGVSPDGKLVAAMIFNGSSLPDDDPLHNDNGLLVILARRGNTYEVVQEVPIGAVTQGAAFTNNGEFLLVQCYASRKIWVFRVNGESVEDTGHRIPTPGFPASLRAVP